MFNVTGGEVVIILVLALVVLGPEKMPDMLRKAGRLYGELRRMATGFQSEFEDTFAEPLREFRDTANQARDMIRHPMDSVTSDPATAVVETSETVALDPVPVAGESGEQPPFVSHIVNGGPMVVEPVAEASGWPEAASAPALAPVPTPAGESPGAAAAAPLPPPSPAFAPPTAAFAPPLPGTPITALPGEVVLIAPTAGWAPPAASAIQDPWAAPKAQH